MENHFIRDQLRNGSLQTQTRAGNGEFDYQYTDDMRAGIGPGLVAMSAPDLVAGLTLSGDEHEHTGLYCDGTFASVDAPPKTYSSWQYESRKTGGVVDLCISYCLNASYPEIVPKRIKGHFQRCSHETAINARNATGVHNR
jgi:hypothetical protein